MSRGDQRERDRAKKQAKLAKTTKAVKEGRPEDRNAADKAKLEAKVAAKKAMKEQEVQEQANASRAPVERKKKETKNGSLDDLLDAGLTKGNKKK